MPTGPWSTSPAAVTVLQSTDLAVVSHDNGDTTFTSKRITIANFFKPLTLTASTVDVGGAFTVSTAVGGTVIFTAKGTIGGASLTDNFLNITATLPAVLTNTTRAMTFQITGAGSSAAQIAAFQMNLLAGYTGPRSTFGINLLNFSAGTGIGGWVASGFANFGLQVQCTGLGAGNNCGAVFFAMQSSSLNVAVQGLAVQSTNSAALNVGTTGFALNATVNVAGFFGLMNSAPTLGTSCALVADNGTTGSEVANFRVNGTVASKVTGGGWFQNTIGEASLTTAFTDATGTLAATNISITVVAGRSYRIEGYLIVSNTTAADGSQFDFNGGTATATLFDIAFSNVGSVVAGTVVGSALNTKLNYTTNTGTDRIYVRGFLKVNAAGTLILRAATNTMIAGTMTLAAGSWLALTDTVQL